MSHKERKIEGKVQLIRNLRKARRPREEAEGLYPLPLFFLPTLKGVPHVRGNPIDNGQFNWILFLFFQADGKGSYRIAFVWPGFIRPLESPTKNALNAICSDSDSIHLQHHQISSLNLDIRLLYISNLNQAYQLCCQLISTFAEDCEHCQKRDINKWTKRSDVQSS